MRNIPEEPGRKGRMGLCVDKIIGVLDDASHAAGLILIVEGRSELIQNDREDLR